MIDSCVLQSSGKNHIMGMMVKYPNACFVLGFFFFTDILALNVLPLQKCLTNVPTGSSDEKKKIILRMVQCIF